MVSYQTFTQLAFDVAKAKGASFSGIDEGGDFITQVAAVWQQDTEKFRQMTERQARNYLQDRVEA
jgi:hypothetical protein